MSELNDIIKSSLEGIKELGDVNGTVGDIITTPSGVTIIPVSKITIGFVGGGADYGQKKLTSAQNFGGGSGSGISITPLAFLTIDKNSSVNLIPIQNESSGVDRLISLLKQSPDLISNFKKSLNN